MPLKIRTNRDNLKKFKLKANSTSVGLYLFG